jgi:RNA polymerase sigma factor (sigma-70 family)
VNESEVLAEQFERHRAHLRAVAYRMLGSTGEAEDAVREAWLRLSRADTTDVDNLRGWLTTVVGRVSLDILRARRLRREEQIDVSELVISTGAEDDPAEEAPAGGVGRARPAGGAGRAEPGRATRLCPPRHVRRPLRGDRADRRPHAGGRATARQPGPPPGAGGRRRRRTPTWRANGG